MDATPNASLGMERILKTDINQINKSFIEDLFAGYHDKESGQFKQANFNTNDKILLTPDIYPFVKQKTNTTLGQLLFNRYILERLSLIQHLGYWDKPLNSGNLNNLNTAINNLVLTDIIDTKVLGEYVDSRDRLGFWCASFLAVSISPKLILPMHDVNKRKAELFHSKANQLNSSNPVEQIMTMNEIEKELVGMVEKNLSEDSGYDFYASGDANLENNYKTINITRGAVYNPSTKKYDIIKNSLMEGVTQKDIPGFSNSIVAGAFPSAIGTAESGYLAKQILALLQSESIDPNPESDCKTTSTIPFEITNRNKQYVLFRNIVVKGKVVLTTLLNIHEFVGQTVQMFSPQGCSQDKICAKCAGKTFYNLGVTQVGLLVTQMTMKMLNLKLKAKHDLSQSAGVIQEEHLFMHDNKHCVIENKILKNKTIMKIFIPRFFNETTGKEDVSSYHIESTSATCLGILPVKFYDNKNNVIFSTMMIIPTTMIFNIYNEVQQDIDNFIITYEPNSEVCRLDFQQSIINVEGFINQIFINSKIPQIPYNIMALMSFRCLEINRLDLTAPAIVYELLARRTCRSGNSTFAKVFSKNPQVDQMSYTKLPVRKAVQESGILQGMLFEHMSGAIQVGLAQTLNGIKPTETPLEKIIKA